MLDHGTLSGPRIEYEPKALSCNFSHLVKLCAARGISFSGVTKSFGGNPEIANLMLDSGIETLADARLVNIARLRAAGISAPVMLLRAPAPDEVAKAARLADIFLLSEIDTITALAGEKASHGRRLEVILMVDLGDLREGIPPAGMEELALAVLALDNVDIVGIGTNLACNLGVLPSERNMSELVSLSGDLETLIGRSLRFVSAGNSSALSLMFDGKLPSKINHLRLGESLVLGRETAFGRALDGMHNDCFTLVGQVIEQKVKSPRPDLERGRNALGQETDITQIGPRRLAVINIGAVDCEIGGLTPLADDVKIVGYSSDHLIVDTTEALELTVGAEVRLRPDYFALATAMTSPYLAQVPYPANGASITSKGTETCLRLR